jgi:peroxiredoxin
MELLRDRSEEFKQADVQTFGVSRDSPWSHVAWTQALDLSFPLLSDWNGEAVHLLEITREWRGFKGIARRTAFLADLTGTIRGAWEYDDSDVPDFDVLLAAAKAL